MEPGSPDWEARAAALLAESPIRELPAMVPPPAPPPQPPLPVPRPTKEIVADSITVNYFGVDPNDAFCTSQTGMGAARGPTGKGYGSFVGVQSLQFEDGITFSTMGAFADYALGNRLGLSGADLIGQIKVTELNGSFKMLDLDAPLAVKYEAGTKAKVELTLFMRGKQMLAARVRTAHARYQVSRAAPALLLCLPCLPCALREGAIVRVSSWWAQKFVQQADAKAGHDLSKTTMAKLIGKGRDTIDTALDPTKCPKDAKTLKAIEAFLDKHFASNFSELAVALARLGIKKGARTPRDPTTGPPPPHGTPPFTMGPQHASRHMLPCAVRRCAGGKAKVADMLDGDEPAAKRSRTYIPKLAAEFIDHYIPLYTANSKNAAQRKALVESIKEAMDVADPTWALSSTVIDTRLDNEMKKANKKAREKAAEEAATEAPVEATAAGVEPLD